MPVEVEIIEDKIPLLVARVEATCRAAVMKVAHAIVRSAQEYVPYDTGDLHDSIEANSVAAGKEAEVTVGMYYGGYVEYGTRFTPAQPFLGPAVDDHSEELLPEIMVAFEGQL